jgi:hypothetical protein
VKTTSPVRNAERMRRICEVRAVIASQTASEARHPPRTHHLEKHRGSIVDPKP